MADLDDALRSELLEVVQVLEKGAERIEMERGFSGYRLVGYRMNDVRGTIRIDCWKV